MYNKKTWEKKTTRSIDLRRKVSKKVAIFKNPVPPLEHGGLGWVVSPHLLPQTGLHGGAEV